jgi:hypothetical protein
MVAGSLSVASPVVTFLICVDKEGNIHNDIQTHGHTFAEVYRAFHAIKAEVDRQINERRNCPFNPLHGTEPVTFEEEAHEPA